MNTLSIEAVVDNLDKVLAFVDAELEEAGCSMKAQIKIDVAVEEIFVNVAHYAYKPNVGMVELILNISGDPAVMEITFVDSGVPYDPLAKEDPDVSLSLEQRKIGGLGIYMVKKSMDDMRYEYRDGQNRLTLVKSLA